MGLTDVEFQSHTFETTKYWFQLSITNVFTEYKISMIRIRTLKHLLEGCVFALLDVLFSSLMCRLFSVVVNARRAKTGNFNEWVEHVYIYRGFEKAKLCVFKTIYKAV